MVYSKKFIINYKNMIKKTWEELQNEKLTGRIFLLPTDTIYGFHSLVFDREGRGKIKRLKQRDADKYFINLISKLDDLKKFVVKITENQRKFLEKIWPGRATVIFRNKKQEKISFRIPAHRKLRKFIEQTGPIVSTSANLQGRSPIKKPLALSAEMKEQIDFFIDEGELQNEPSVILEIVR